MKKRNWIAIMALSLVLLKTNISLAQSQRVVHGVITPIKTGSVILNLGIGAGAGYRDHYYNTAFGTKIAAEWGLWKAGSGVITLGAEAGGSFSNGYYDDYRSRTIIVAGRSAWHYGWKVRGLDTYGGLSAGLGLHHYDYRNNDDYDRSEVIPVAGIFLGASYFITPVFGFNAEAGYDITNLQIGVVFKLK
jgi:hypothetical protein